MKDFFLSFLNSPHFKYTLIIVISLFVAAIASKIIKRLLKTYFELSSQKLKNDATSYKFIRNTVGFLVYMIAIIFIFYFIPKLKALGLTLLASAGIFTAIIAMASAQAFSNIISGIFIVIFKPFRVDDRIKIGEKYIGTVEDITLRHTVIKDFENQRIIIPNSIISSQTVLNVSIIDESVCNFLEIPVPFDADLDIVKQIILDSTTKHKHFIDKRTPEEKEEKVDIVPIRITGFVGYLINVRANIWTENATKGFALKCDLREEIVKKLRELNIFVSLPAQEVIVKNKHTT